MSLDFTVSDPRGRVVRSVSIGQRDFEVLGSAARERGTGLFNRLDDYWKDARVLSTELAGWREERLVYAGLLLDDPALLGRLDEAFELARQLGLRVVAVAD